jgi:hypothetical protein
VRTTLVEKMVVPSDYFTRLVDALSALPIANEPLRRAAKQAPSVVASHRTLMRRTCSANGACCLSR